MAGTVDMRNLKRQLRNRYAYSHGSLAMQFCNYAPLGFLSVMSLKGQGLPTSMGITLLIVTASPGGSYSNWWCSLFNADLALSVAMTALSTILSIGLLPANLMLYAHAAYGFDSQDENNVLKSVDFVALFISLAIVIGAILSGLYASYKTDSAKFRRISNSIGSLAGIALIILSAVFSTNGSEEGARPWEQHWSFYVGVALPCVGGLILANVIAKWAQLEKPEVVTLSVECCYQNVGIAASTVLSMFDNKQDVARAMAVPLLYGIVEAVILGFYCLMAWKFGWTKAPSDEKICIVLAKTYEVDDEADEETALQGGGDGGGKAGNVIREKDDASRAISMAHTASTAPSQTTSVQELTLHVAQDGQVEVKDEFIVSPPRIDPKDSPRYNYSSSSNNNSNNNNRQRSESIGNLSYDSDHSGISFDTSGKSTRRIGGGGESMDQLNSISFQRNAQSEIVASASVSRRTIESNTRARSHDAKIPQPLYDLSGGTNSRGYIVYSHRNRNHKQNLGGTIDDDDLEC
jgi:Predicted Na+-dependent transporter